jgi:hypothetical protein
MWQRVAEGKIYLQINMAHYLEGGNAGRDLDLDIDRAGLDALERDRGYTLDHELPWTSLILAQAPWPFKNICRTS